MWQTQRSAKPPKLLNKAGSVRIRDLPPILSRCVRLYLQSSPFWAMLLNVVTGSDHFRVNEGDSQGGVQVAALSIEL